MRMILSEAPNIATYLIILVFSGVGAYFGAYLKIKAKNLATKEDFKEIIKRVEKNTEVVEGVKNRFYEKGWISQQVWLKKQEAYSAIFLQLVSIKNYVTHQVGEYFEWEGTQNPGTLCNDDSIEKWERGIRELEKKWKSPEYIEKSKKFERDYDKSLPKLFDLIDIHSIYLDHRVEDEISKLKQELSIADPDEDDEWLLRRRSGAINDAIAEIRSISKSELKIGELA
jgi:hypothetical protein